jgi:hypothetical protein
MFIKYETSPFLLSYTAPLMQNLGSKALNSVKLQEIGRVTKDFTERP